MRKTKELLKEQIDSISSLESNKQTIQDFILVIEQENKSKSTQILYLNVLLKALEYFDKPFEELTEMDVRKFFKEHLFVRVKEYVNYRGAKIVRNKEKGMNIKQSSQLIRAIKFKYFIKWLYQVGDNEQVPKCVSWIKSKNFEQEEITKERILTGQELQQLIKFAPTTRDKALISGLFTTGCRVQSEFLPMKWSKLNIDIVHSVASYEVENRKTRKKTGVKTRKVFFSGTAFQYLLQWKRECPQDTDYIWVSTTNASKGKQIQHSTAVMQIMKRAGKYTDVDATKLFPHNIRHSRARHLNLKGTPPQIIYKLLGWSDKSGAIMNSVYSKMDDTDIEEYLITEEGKPNGNIDINQVKAKRQTLEDYEAIVNLDVCPNCKKQISRMDRSCSCGAVFDNTIMIDKEAMLEHKQHMANALVWADEQNKKELADMRKELEEMKNAITQKKAV